MINLTEEEAQKMLGGKYKAPKRHKYNAKKTYVDGIPFDSRKEANYYGELKMRRAAGEILDFELQPEFELQGGFKHEGKAIRAIKYRADFKIIHKNFDVEIVDCKGFRTKEYAIKKKLLLAKYPDIHFIEA